MIRRLTHTCETNVRVCVNSLQVLLSSNFPLVLLCVFLFVFVCLAPVIDDFASLYVFFFCSNILHRLQKFDILFLVQRQASLSFVAILLLYGCSDLPLMVCKFHTNSLQYCLYLFCLFFFGYFEDVSRFTINI